MSNLIRFLTSASGFHRHEQACAHTLMYTCMPTHNGTHIHNHVYHTHKKTYEKNKYYQPKIFLLLFIYFYFMCIRVMQCLWKTEEGIRLPGSRATDSYLLPRGYWNKNPGPLQKQPVFLTTEPSFQSLKNILITSQEKDSLLMQTTEIKMLI